MRFEHLLQVNDLSDPRLLPMSRSELWRGLMLRVESPQRFPLGPDRCESRAGTADDERVRRIHYGNLRFDDRVRLDFERRIEFLPEPHGDAPPVRLTLTIEEPAPGALFLRFVYTADGIASAEATALQGYREQAWLENDRDMLRSLRTWHADGEL